MSIATVITDSTRVAVSRKAGNHGKAPTPEPSGDGPQQRFADVLPLAQAAAGSPTEKAQVVGKSSTELVAAKSPVREGRRVQSKGEKVTTDPGAAAWLPAGTVPPVVPRQAQTSSPAAPTARVAGAPSKATVPGQSVPPAPARPKPTAPNEASSPIPQASKAATTGPASTEAQPAQPTQRANPPRQTPQLQQTSKVEQPAIVSVGANVVATVTATPENQQMAPPRAAAKGQVPSAPQRATSAPVVQAAAGDGRIGRVEGAKKQVQKSPGRQAVHPASQGEGTELSASLKRTSTPDLRPHLVAEKTSEGQVKPQVVQPQPVAGNPTPGGSEKSPQGQESPTDGRQDPVSRRPMAASSEGMKGEPARSESKDGPVVGPKEATAALPAARTSPAGEGFVLSQPSPAPARNQAGVDAAPVRTPLQSIGEQILDSVQASAARGDRQVLIRLTPPELGTVLVRFQENGQQLSGTLEVSSRETRREIEQALPQVVRSLQEAGIQIRRVEVVTSDQPEPDLGGEHLPQDVWQQHQGSGQSREHSHASPQARWPQGTPSHSVTHPRTAEDEPHTAVAPGRIDLLL